MKLSAHNIEELARLALKACQSAADHIQAKSQQVHTVLHKTGVESLATQVVTAIDIESQQLIMDHLKPSMTEFDLGLLTEECDDDGSRLVKDYFWCVDPLDGTLPFTEQSPGYAVSIALVNIKGDPELAVVIDPYHQQYWTAIRGRGVQRNSVPFTGMKPSLTMFCRIDRSFKQSIHYEFVKDQLNHISQKLGYESMKIYSGYGAVMNAISLLESEACCYLKLPKATRGGGCIWDYAATRLIFEELGCKATDTQGNSIMLNSPKTTYMNKRGIIYSTKHELHVQLLNLVHQISLLP